MRQCWRKKKGRKKKDAKKEILLTSPRRPTGLQGAASLASVPPKSRTLPQHSRSGAFARQRPRGDGRPQGAEGLTLPHFHDDLHGARLADPSFPVLQAIQCPVGSGCKKREGAFRQGSWELEGHRWAGPRCPQAPRGTWQELSTSRRRGLLLTPPPPAAATSSCPGPEPTASVSYTKFSFSAPSKDAWSGEDVTPPASPRCHIHTSEPFSAPAPSSPFNSWIISFAPWCIIGTHAYAQFKLYIYNYTLCLSKECKLRAPMGLSGFNCRAEVS